jgi:hypothetical protein
LRIEAAEPVMPAHVDTAVPASVRVRADRVIE